MYSAGAAMMGVRRRFFMLALAAGLSACGEPPAPEPVLLDLGGETVQLPPGTRVHDVSVTAAPGASEYVPRRVQLRVGDVIRFTSRDAGPHALRFDPPLDPPAATFLEQTGQTRALPLVGSGAAWVIAFADAPPGPYTVRCLTHDETLDIAVTAAAGPER